jgi:parallel beta-helix repeat protein
MRPIRVCLVIAAIGGCSAQPEITSPLPFDPGADWVTAVACGDQLTSDTRLESDLMCSGDALTIAADGITLNLNGHTITGDGTGNGITVRQRSDVTIHGGAVNQFITGIFVAQSTGVMVKDNSFTLNREAVFLNGSSVNIVKSNVAWNNSSRGIMLRPTTSGIVSTGNMVVDNTLTGNPSGILIFGQSGNTLKGNTITGSSVGAFDLTGGGGSGNVIKENNLFSSAAGIKFGPGWNGGNEITGNTLQLNVCGLLGPGSLNTYKDNVFTLNVSDICP